MQAVLMQAVLIPDSSGRGAHLLRLPEPQDAGTADLAALVQGALTSAGLLGDTPLQGPVRLEAGAWRLSLTPLRQLRDQLASQHLDLVELTSSHPHTHVAAAALGLDNRWPHASEQQGGGPGDADPAVELVVHQGTLRSGDHLQVEGTVLLLGDVNPGARISAGGHVLVWGRLRGIAHAGCHGDSAARIVALQLRPLQLRIATAVARGPEGLPPEGLAEEARIVNGAIQIDPAQPSWPLSG
jgi:septum site-determining protein MinC